MNRVRVAILISGRGSNLLSLLKAFAHNQTAKPILEIALVISSNAAAAGLDYAKEFGVTSLVVDKSNYPNKIACDLAMDLALRDAKIDLVCLAGYMRILSARFVESWRGRLINIHPSLLPDYRGLDTHARAIADGKAEAGCTVHYVETEIDCGEIILQERVKIAKEDSPESLAARVLAVEHRLYPLAVDLVAQKLLAQMA